MNYRWDGGSLGFFTAWLSHLQHKKIELCEREDAKYWGKEWQSKSQVRNIDLEIEVSYGHRSDWVNESKYKLMYLSIRYHFQSEEIDNPEVDWRSPIPHL